MKKNYLLLLIIFFSINSNAQKDSIISYFDKKGKNVAIDKAKYYEVMTKQHDSLWFVKRFIKNNNKIKKTHFFTTPKKEKQIGEENLYNLKGQIVATRYYNKEGKKNGKATKWFDNGNINFIGNYKNGEQEGSWKFYRTNGKLAAEKKYRAGVLENEMYFDEKGEKLTTSDFINKEEKAFFKGGKEKYYKKIQSLSYKLKEFRKRKKINYTFSGRIIVRYIIDINGEIKEVTIDEPLPKDMNDFIVNWFENLKGWSPEIQMNRKVPKAMTQSLNFKTKKK